MELRGGGRGVQVGVSTGGNGGVRGKGRCPRDVDDDEDGSLKISQGGEEVQRKVSMKVSSE